jgi:hypothetical protein
MAKCDINNKQRLFDVLKSKDIVDIANDNNIEYSATLSGNILNISVKSGVDNAYIVQSLIENAVNNSFPGILLSSRTEDGYINTILFTERVNNTIKDKRNKRIAKLRFDRSIVRNDGEVISPSGYPAIPMANDRKGIIKNLEKQIHQEATNAWDLGEVADVSNRGVGKLINEYYKSDVVSYYDEGTDLTFARVQVPEFLVDIYYNELLNIIKERKEKWSSDLMEQSSFWDENGGVDQYNSISTTNTNIAKEQYSQYLEQNPNGTVEGFKSWVDNNQTNIQYQKQIDLQVEQDAVLEEFANSLSERFNISFDSVSEEEARAILPKYTNEPAFFDPKTKKAYLVKGKANKTSAIHEIFTHPFLLQIEKTNPTLYKNLLKEAKNNKSIVDYVDNLYGTKQNNDHEYIARAIDLAVQGELDQQKDKTLLGRIQDFFNQLSDYLKELFNIPKVFSSAISPNITLQQLTQFAMYGKGKMNLNPAQENIEYSLKATNVIVKNLDKIKQWEKNKSISEDVLWKKIQELGVPREQVELVKNSEGNTVEEKLLNFANRMSYTVEINTAKESLKPIIRQENITKEIFESVNVEPEFDGDPESYSYVKETPEAIYYATFNSEGGEYYTKSVKGEQNNDSSHYSNLTVPGGTNYTENEIATPTITPSIKGHAQFATDNGIGWFRSDDKTIVETPETVEDELDLWTAKKVGDKIIIPTNKPTKTRRILEVQSDLFQKGRGKESLTTKKEALPNEESEFNATAPDWMGIEDLEQKPFIEKDVKGNQFLQLLNKDNNWVTFFVKSIIQDSARQTVTEVQESDVEAKVRELEKEGLLEIDCKGLKAEKGLVTSFTKGGKWKLIKDLKDYPTHKEGGVDLTIGKDGVKIKNGNSEFTAKHGLVIPKN